MRQDMEQMSERNINGQKEQTSERNINGQMEQNSTQGNPLGYERISVLLRKFAIPSVIAMVVSSLYNIVDQIFIGNGVGFKGNAATNVSFPLTTICLAIALLIGVGSATRYSLSLGEGNQERAKGAVGNGLGMMLLFGMIYAIVIEIFMHPMLIAFGATSDVMGYAMTYSRITAIGMPCLILTNGISNLARADGSPKFSMTCMLIGAIINTLLDPIFIFIFHWGVAGAAWATVIGEFFSFLMAFSYLRKFRQIKFTLRDITLNVQECLSIATLGMSNSLNQVALTFVQIVLNNSLTHYGAMTTYGKEIPLAAAGIVMKTNAILIGFIVGISQGSQPIIGFNYGARQYQRVKQTYKLAIMANLVISAIAFIMFEFFTPQVIALYGTGDPLYFEFAVMFMKTFLFMCLLNGVQMISSNFFSAIGKPLKGLLLSMTRQVLFLIPLVLILPLFFGLTVIMYAAPVADFIAFCVTGAMIMREMNQMKKLEMQISTMK